jgi:hypothetical protein
MDAATRQTNLTQTVLCGNHRPPLNFGVSPTLTILVTFSTWFPSNFFFPNIMYQPFPFLTQ